MQPSRAINDLVQVGALSRDRLMPIGNGTRDSSIQALRDYNTDVIVLSEELAGIHSAYQEAEDDPDSGTACSSEHNRDTIRRLQQYSYLA